MYTTIDNVREFSGFDDPTKISGSVIRNKISMADSKIDGSIAYRYLLPLKYHRQNRLTFSGLGTGAGNMTITINGSDYVIAITDAMTPSQAADLFRIEAESNDDFITEGFITDDTSGDATVTIISKEDSGELTTASTQVDITDGGGLVQGITGTGGIRQDRYTPMIEQLSSEIATALLYMDNYGVEAQDTPQDGVVRMERLDVMLTQLQGNSEDGLTIRLMDEITKIELDQAVNGLPQYFPSEENSDPNYKGPNPTKSNIRMNDVY